MKTIRVVFIILFMLSFMALLTACTETGGVAMKNINNNSETVINKNSPKEESGEEDILYITVGETVLTATLVDNSSTKALKKLLEKSPLEISMQDYGGFEKVGAIGVNLPRNDERITTVPGDLILYQGNQFVIYYDTNTWDFTRLGKIENVTKKQLLDVLGSGDVTVKLSMSEQ